VPLRSELAPEDTWDLSLLYPTDAAWEAAFEQLKIEYPQIEAFRGKMGDSASVLLELLAED